MTRLGDPNDSSKTRTVVCVAGCMRSGSSMITHILNICGMNLGAQIDLLEPDRTGNPAGYWENVKFLQANKVIMQTIDEASGKFTKQKAANTARISSLEEAYMKAFEFLNTELKGGFVGWKDPNNSFTVGFWKNVVPGLKVILCVRNPFDVAMSISESPLHGLNFEQALQLWQQSTSCVYKAIGPQDLIITHFENYFIRPEQEIHRLLQALGVTPKPAAVGLAVKSIEPSLRH